MKTIIAGLLLSVSVSANAGFISGNELYKRLTGESVVGQSYALGYIIGVADAYDGGSHCIPDGVNAGQIRDVVKNFMDATPEVRHRPADLIVYAILKNTWACAEKKKGRPGA
jgi:hypothetical protein